MTSFPKQAGLRSWFVAVIVLGLVMSSLAPGVALAQSELYPGAVALVANTGGQPVLLRETPGFEGAVLSSFPEGTAADVLEGPVYAADGSAWYGVAAGGLTGYIVAGYLIDSAQGAAPVELAQEAVPAEALPAPATSLAEVSANPTATADLNLRAGPSYDDAVLLVIPAGAALTTTGEWSAGFVGVTYEGQYGWVDSSWLGSGEAAPQEVALLQEAAPVAETALESAALVGDLAAPAGTAAYAVDVVNLRLGPSENDEIPARAAAGRGGDDHRREQQRLDAGLVQRHLGLRQRRPPHRRSSNLGQPRPRRGARGQHGDHDG